MQLLKLRYLQAKRDLSYWVIIFAALIFFITQAVSGISHTYSLCLMGTVLFFLYTYHTNRKDLNFINKYFDAPKKNLCINYNLLLLPFSTAFLYNQLWLFAMAFHACATLIVFIDIKTGGPKLIFIRNYIPAAHFEWIAGLRQNLFVLIPLFLLCLFFSPVKFFGTVSLFLLNSIFLGFYSSFEPLVMLNPEHQDVDSFLKKKAWFFSKVILVLNIPLLLINSAFHIDIAWFNACFLAGFLLLASCAVYIKYASYKPNDELRFHIDYLLLFASALIPFLLPIAFLLNSSHKKKAIQNLLHYTDDNSQDTTV